MTSESQKDYGEAFESELNALADLSLEDTEDRIQRLVRKRDNEGISVDEWSEIGRLRAHLSRLRFERMKGNA